MSSLAGALEQTWSANTQSQNEHREPEQDEEMADDLFGNDEAEDNEPVSGAESYENLPTPERERRRAQEYEEDDAPPEDTIEVREAYVEFPNIPVPKTSSGENWVMRMPNFMKLDPKPFHPDTYMGPEQEEDDGNSTENLREKSMSIKLRVENTVRWKWTKDAQGRDKKQANARIISWSDGTQSLRLGSEYFDITKSVDSSSGKAFGSSQQSQQPAKSEGLTYIVAQHKRSQVLQAEALVTGYMSLRPTSMQSETHRMLVRAVGQKHSKVARLRMAPDPTVDPEKEKNELLKQSAKNSKKKRSEGEGGRRRQSRKSRSASVWSDEDEGQMTGSDDDDDAVRRQKHRARPAEDSRKEQEADYQHDDFVVGDSDEEGSAGGGGKRKHNDDDELERMDAQIEGSYAKRRRDSKDVDVESEEEEDADEHSVRPLGRTGGTRRKLHIEEEDEDD